MHEISKKKRAAMLCAAAVIGFLLAYFGSVLIAVAMDDAWAALAILGIYGLMILAAVVGIVLALRQRMRELDTGEEEDAKQY